MSALSLRAFGNMAAKTGSTTSMRVALVQMAVTHDKNTNLAVAERSIADAASHGADMVVLPECFNSPYGPKFFPKYSETVPGPTTQRLAAAAKHHQIHVVGGSIPELHEAKLYNTCTVYNREGVMVAKHRKIHLFDIDVPGKIRFQESETLSAGNKPTIFTTEHCKIGVGVCYDVRFAELAMLYADQGCHVLIYPGAFNMTTGPRHWELLMRSRANDNQLFVCAASPARDENADYVAWGHSMVADPWGEVLASADHQPCIVYADLDMAKVDDVRAAIPIRRQKRNDVYSTPQLQPGTEM